MSQYMHVPNTVCQDETLGGGVGEWNGTVLRRNCFETKLVHVRACVRACVCQTPILKIIFNKISPPLIKIKGLFDSFFL